MVEHLNEDHSDENSRGGRRKERSCPLFIPPSSILGITEQREIDILLAAHRSRTDPKMETSFSAPIGHVRRLLGSRQATKCGVWLPRRSCCAFIKTRYALAPRVKSRLCRTSRERPSFTALRMRVLFDSECCECVQTIECEVKAYVYRPGCGQLKRETSRLDLSQWYITMRVSTELLGRP